MKSEFNKEVYFQKIRNILLEVRKKGIPYNRAYSEPRKKTVFRTKLWICSSLDVKKIQKIADDLYPGAFDVYATISQREFRYRHTIDKNVEIIPKDLTAFIK